MTPESVPERPEPKAVSVVVIGAGYAGVMATNRLLASLTPAEADRVQVAVVNPRPEFVERIRLHELAAGSSASVFLPLADTLHRDARLLAGAAAASRVVVVGGGFTGVEAAAEIAEQRPGLDVTLL